MGSTENLVAELGRYCAEHPHACDTLNGITWWLAGDRERADARSMSDAVSRLVEDGRLVRHQLADGSSRFLLRHPSQMIKTLSRQEGLRHA